MSKKNDLCRKVSFDDIKKITDSMSKTSDDNLHMSISNSDNSMSELHEIKIEKIHDGSMYVPSPDKKMRQKNTTSSNNNSTGLLWTNDIESVIKGWHHKCINNAQVHNKKYATSKKIYYGLSIPGGIIPLTLAALSTDLVGQYAWVNKIGLIFTGVLTTINGHLNPGGKAKSHQDFSSSYDELAVEIKSELVKPRNKRQEAGIFLQRVMDKYNNLNNRAPSI
jgi:hypothetical protein